MSYVVSDVGSTIYRYDGSLVSLQTGGLLDVNLVNFGDADTISASFRTEGGFLNAKNEASASVSLEGGEWQSVDFLGAGTMQTLTLLGINVLSVPAMAFAVGGQVYLYLPQGPALLSGLASSFSLRANASIDLPDTKNVCLANGCRIATAQGERLIESLKVGDLVMTKDHGLKPILMIEEKPIPVALQLLNAHQRPVLIAAESLGPRKPRRDIHVSQQHCILLRHAGCERLVRATHLVGQTGITLAPPRPSLRYYHLLFDRHELIRADGLWVESLYLGPEALLGLSAQSRAFIDAQQIRAPHGPARPLLSRHDLKGPMQIGI